MVDNTKDLTPNVKAAEVEFEQEEQSQLERANERIMRMRLGLPER
jgi:hypothetical protein